MANALAGETSPYLLQHKDNPVDWLPWGPEAIERARELDRPMLVSIGYSACHWCHVMERECFEDDEIAALMNELFVCIKVDREERPDVDAIYMEAVQAMTGSGGWPLNVFTTPEQVPFYARYVLPAAAAPRDAELAGRPGGGRAGLGHAARGDSRAERRDGGTAERRRAAAGRRGAARRADPRRRARPAGGPVRLAQRRLGPRAEVPGSIDDRVPAAPRGDADEPLHAAVDGVGRHQRPDRRRLRALLHRRELDRPALREDALRQRDARPRVSARLAGQRHGRRGPRSDPAPHRRGDARLGAARDDRSRGRVLQRSRRRLRGRRGQVLRVGPRGAAQRAGRRRRRGDHLVRGQRGWQLRGREHPRVARARARAGGARAHSRRAAGRARRAHPARASTTSA